MRHEFSVVYKRYLCAAHAPAERYAPRRIECHARMCAGRTSKRPYREGGGGFKGGENGEVYYLARVFFYIFFNKYAATVL